MVGSSIIGLWVWRHFLPQVCDVIWLLGSLFEVLVFATIGKAQSLFILDTLEYCGNLIPIPLIHNTTFYQFLLPIVHLASSFGFLYVFFTTAMVASTTGTITYTTYWLREEIVSWRRIASYGTKNLYKTFLEYNPIPIQNDTLIEFIQSQNYTISSNMYCDKVLTITQGSIPHLFNLPTLLV